MHRWMDGWMEVGHFLHRSALQCKQGVQENVPAVFYRLIKHGGE